MHHGLAVHAPHRHLVLGPELPEVGARRLQPVDEPGDGDGAGFSISSTTAIPIAEAPSVS
jgi:hypothetical protein